MGDAAVGAEEAGHWTRLPGFVVVLLDILEMIGERRKM